MNKFTIIKNEDIRKYLSSVDANDLEQLIERLRVSKACNSGNPNKNNSYAVINLDEPYADVVINIMKAYGHWGD